MTPPRVQREIHGQLDASSTTGDCFRACMSVLLDVPNGDHLPHGINLPDWWLGWWNFLWGFGLALCDAAPDGPIWKEGKWVASVPSKNYDGCTHAIVMEGHRVLFDPSPKRRYRAGVSLLGADVVVGGTWLEVADASRLDGFCEWRNHAWAEHRGAPAPEGVPE